MKIILKHTLSSIKKNIGQMLIMIITMIIITATAFVSLSVTDIFKKNVEVTSYNVALNNDISVRADFLNREKFDEIIEENKEYIKDYHYSFEAGFTIKSDYDTTKIQLNMTSVNKMLNMLETPIIKETENTTEYPGIIVSRVLAEKLLIDVGDIIETSTVSYGGIESKMFVSKIVENSVYFYSVGSYRAMADDGEVITYLGEENLPYNTNIVRLYLNSPDAPYPNDEEGRSVKVYLRDYIDEKMKFFGTPLWNVEIYEEDIDAGDSIIKSQNTLNVVIAIIVLLMVFILYFSYSIIAKNRGEMIIRFKAAGATPLQTVGIMLVEVIFYALIACTIGVILGRFVNDTVASIMLYSKSTLLTYEPWKYVVSMLVGIVTGILSCLVPAYKISKKSIRQLMSGDMLISKRARLFVPIIFTVLLGVCFILLFTLPKYALYCMIALVIVGCFWVVTVTPYILKLLSKIIGKIFSQKEGKLATFGLHRNSGIATVTAMLSLMISFIWAGISIIDVIATVDKDENTQFTSDFIIEENRRLTNDEIVKELDYLTSLDGLDFGVVYRKYSGFLSVDDRNLEPVEGQMHNYAISEGEGIKFFTRDWDESLVEAFNNTKRPVIISYESAQKLGKEIGDTLKVSVWYRNELRTLDGDFTIVGIDHYYTRNENDCIIKLEDVVRGEDDFTLDWFFFAFSGDDDKFLSLREQIDSGVRMIFRTSGFYTTILENADMFAIMKYISYFFYIVSAISLINLITITSIERKKEMEIFRLVGLTSGGSFKMTFVEGIIISLSALIMGLILAIAISYLQPIFCSLMGRYALFDIFPKRMFQIAFVASTIGLLMWMASPLFSTTLLSNKDTKTIHSAD